MIEYFRPFAPFVVIAFCLLVGRWMRTSPRIPNWLIPPTLAVIGVVIGGMTTAIAGGDARATILVGLSGLVAVGVHQNWRQMTGRGADQTVLVTTPATPPLAEPVVLQPLPLPPEAPRT